jgi:hypothetical protein
MSQCLYRRDNAISRHQVVLLLPRVSLKVWPVPSPVELPGSAAADLVSLARTWQFRCHAAQPPRAPAPLS